MLNPGDEVSFSADNAVVGVRLDQVLSQRFRAYSRSYLARAIERGAVRVDGVTAKASLKLKEGAVVCFTVPEPPRSGPEAEEMPLEFLFIDEVMAVVNKPSGMVVHPAKGNWKGTLAGGLKWHLERRVSEVVDREGLSQAGGPTRPGIVHRLDRDTSGVIVVARNDVSHQMLAKQFEKRTVQKTYLAITQGQPEFDRDEIRLAIGVHPYQREKMAVRSSHSTSRDAVTRFEVLERFKGAALVKVFPKTGRTHQIRVHLAAIGCPVLADALYSGRSSIEPKFFGGPKNSPAILGRQALHAESITLDHPVTGERVTFSSPLPSDIQGVLDGLRKYASVS